MTSQPGKQKIHILLKISRNKANRILHEKHFFFEYTKSKLNVSLGKQSNDLDSSFLLFVKLKAINIY